MSEIAFGSLIGNEGLLPLLTVLSRFTIAIIIVIAGFLIGRSVGSFVENAIRSLKLNGFGKNKGKRRIDVVVGNVVKYVIFLIAAIVALNQIGIALNFLNQVLTILLIIVALGLFLSIKDFVPNAVAGAYIIYKGRIKVGQTIKIKDLEGEVVKVDLVDTKIKTKKGHDILIPNSFFLRNIVSIKK